MIITTEHGTKFEINLKEKTWARIDKTGDSGNLRSESGTFFDIHGPILGQSLILRCPSFNAAGLAYRVIQTSRVESIADEEVQ